MTSIAPLRSLTVLAALIGCAGGALDKPGESDTGGSPSSTADSGGADSPPDSGDGDGDGGDGGDSGDGDTLAPVALFDCPTGVLPLDSLRLDGSPSYDPDGGSITAYAWSIAASPAASSTTLEDAETDRPGLFVDAVGLWEVTLLVTDDEGVGSAPASCTFEATPEEALYVELSWDRVDVDLDLHLIQSGAEAFVSPSDCCWCNRAPEWGAGGVEDDPTLHLDDRFGYGPEVISLSEPPDGDYEVATHYFADLGGGAAQATVNVYLYGALASTTTEWLSQADLWTAGTVLWPSAGVSTTTAGLTPDIRSSTCE